MKTAALPSGTVVFGTLLVGIMDGNPVKLLKTRTAHEQSLLMPLEWGLEFFFFFIALHAEYLTCYIQIKVLVAIVTL